MQKNIFSLFLVLAFLFNLVSLKGRAVSPDSKLIGMNLGGIADWNGDNVFVDLMKKSRTWITFATEPGYPWETKKNEFIPVDENGYATKVPFSIPDGPDQRIRTVINHSSTYLPHGEYLFTYEGEGDFRFWPGNDLNYRELEPGKGIITIAKDNQSIFLEIFSST